VVVLSHKPYDVLIPVFIIVEVEARMDFRTLGTYLYSLIGQTRTRRSREDAPRNACGSTSMKNVDSQNAQIPNALNGQIVLKDEDTPASPCPCLKPPLAKAKQQDIRMVLARQKFADLPDIVRPQTHFRCYY